MTTISETVQLTVITCGECGGTYALNERYRKHKEDKGQGWHCPYCEISWGYFGEGKIGELTKQLVQERQRLDQIKADRDRLNTRAIQLERQRSALKGLVTKERNKAAKGLCPCCGEQFSNVASHMKNRHPEFVAKNAPEPIET